MDWIRTIRVKVKAPFIELGGVYELNDETGEVFRISGNDKIGPLRPSLAQYGPAAMRRAARLTCVEGMPHRCMLYGVISSI